MFSRRNVLVACLAGVMGCIANSLALAVMAPDASFLHLIFSAGREFFSVVFAMALIPIFSLTAGATSYLVAFVALNALASLSAKLVWGAGAPWSFVLFVNGIYAIVAIAVYATGRRNDRAPSGL